jgi:hypothetical protein
MLGPALGLRSHLAPWIENAHGVSRVCSISASSPIVSPRMKEKKTQIRSPGTGPERSPRSRPQRRTVPSWIWTQFRMHRI